MARVGTAYVEVDADFSSFDRQVNRRVSDLQSRFAAVGSDAGRDFSRSFERSVGGSVLGGLERDIDRARGQIKSMASDAGGSLGQLGQMASRAGGDLERAGRRGAAAFGDADREARRAARGVSGLASAADGGGGGFNRLSRAVGSFGDAGGGATATLGGLRVALAGLIPVAIGFGGASVSVASALAPMVGLAAAAGNALGAAAQGFGVFKLATMGVADALKEQAANQLSSAGAAAGNAAAQRSAARAIQSAQEGVRAATGQLIDAQRDARTAQTALSQARTDARRALVDMNASLEDAILTEERAILTLQDAKNELARTVAGASPQDLERAQQDVTQALHDQEQAVLNLERAQARLIEVNNDAKATDLDRRQAALDVAQAQDAITDAQNRAKDSQAELDKVRAGASDQEKRKALIEVKEAENAVADATRDRARQEKDVAAANAKGVKGAEAVVAAQQAVADANKAVSEASRNVTRAQQAVRDAQLSAKESAAGAAASTAKLNKAMDDLPAPAQRFVRTLASLKPRLDELRQTAAAGFFPGATSGLLSATRNFDSIRKVVGQTAGVLGEFARKAGELVGSKAFGRDIETIGGRNARVLDKLGDASLHLVNVVKDLLVTSGPLTLWLADTAKGWAESASAATNAGRRTGKLGEFFDRTRRVLQRVGSIIGHVASGLFGMGKAGQTSGNDILASIDRLAARFDRWANSVRGQTALRDFFRESKDLAAALARSFAGIATAIGFIVLKFAPLTEVLRIVGPITEELTYAFIGYKAALFAVGLAGKAAAAGQVAWNTAMATSPAARIFLGVAALGGAFYVAYQKSETFRGAVDRLVDRFQAAAEKGGSLSGALDSLKTAFQNVKHVVISVADIAGAVWRRFGDDAMRVVEGFVSTVSGLIASATKILVGVTDFVAGVFTGDWSRAWDGVKGIVTGVWGAIKTIVTGALEHLKIILGAAWGLIKDGVRDAWDWVRDKIVGAVRGARDLLEDVVAGIGSRLSSGWASIRNAVGDAWDWVRDKILGALRGARDGISEIVAGIGNRLSEGWTAIRTAVAEAWDFVKDKILDALRGARDGIKDIVDSMWNRLETGFTNIKKGLGEIAGNIRDTISDAFKNAANGVIGFVNQIIKAVNLIPGVPNIGLIDKLAEGGTVSRASVDGLARGGTVHHDQFARGGKITRPMVVVGEEAPVHPEYVIPTNPAYRGRAIGLHAQLSKQLGIPGFVEGGVLGGLKNLAGGALDLLSDGAKGLLGKLPGVGDLPDWIKGLGHHVLKQVTGWMKDKAGGILDRIVGGGAGDLSGDSVESVAKMVSFMNAVDAKGWPYVYGGGHGSFAGPYDCSGLVSAVLHAGGLLNTTMTTDGLKVYGESGDGDVVTIGVRGSTGRNAHTMMKIGNRFLESGSGHGAKWVDGWSGHFPIHRHPPGFAMGGIVDKLLDRLVGDGGLGWGLAKGGTVNGSLMPFVGSYRFGGTVPRDGLAHVHKGETITPANAVPVHVTVENHVELDGEKLDRRVTTHIVENDRVRGAAYRAGVLA